MKLDRLLDPRSIVTVGGAECARVIEECDRLGFVGSIHAVHPSRKRLAGRACLRDLSELLEGPDAAFVAVPNRAAIAVVRELAAMGCGGAVIYSAGFAEAGLADLQAELIAAAGDMPIVGPNCYGLIDATSGAALWPDVHGCRRLTPGERGIALVTQSSNVAINLTMQRRGLPIARVLTAGNQAQTGLADLAMAALRGPQVAVLAMHIEGLGDPETFAELAHAAHEAGKPIVVLKAGRSLQAVAAAQTHTASLAGGHAAHAAFFRHLGVAEVISLEALIEASKLLLACRPLAGKRVLSLSCSGGEAALMADAGARHGIVFPDLGNARADLAEALGPRVTLANPLDYHTFIWGDRVAMIAMFAAAAKVDADMTVLIIDWPRGDLTNADDLESWANAIEAFREVFAGNGHGAAVLATLPENAREELVAPLLRDGIAVLGGMDAALEAIAAVAALDPTRPWMALPALTSGTDQTLDEAEAKAALRAHGLNVPEHETVHGAEDALAAAKRIGGPVAIKALGLAHKSEHGAVRLDLRDADEVAEAAHDLLRLSDRLLVEAMSAGQGVEVLVGVSRDPVLGPVLTIGAGGVFAEWLDDVAILMLPTNRALVDDAFSSLQLARLLDGFRGSLAVDRRALAEAVLAIADYAVANAETLVELDVNPLIATATGATAVDALIIKKVPGSEDPETVQSLR